jgi:hypothetical protein
MEARMKEAPDFQALLDEAVAERDRLNVVINWLTNRLGQPAGEGTAPTAHIMKAGTPMRFPRLATDAFFRMSVSDAIKAYLAFVKKPQTAREITDGLIAGGLTFKAKNLYQTVFPTLSRMAKETGEVAKLNDNTWGLAEWYSSARRAVAVSTPESTEK